jgi:2-phospho-L-lactate/phosphoenolpyruvate guanylyltransferase
VAVPVKALASAKQRLMPALSAAERHALAHAMLEDVLQALASAVAGSIVVITTDAEVTAMSRRYGAACLIERADRGHTAAVAVAQRHAHARGADRFLTIPGDVPCVTANEVRTLLDALGERPGVAFVPSLSGLGTNAALLAPPDAMPLKFGEPSFQNHLEAARRRGFEPAVLMFPGLGLDIDSGDDLGMLLERGPRTRSAALLREWGVRARDARAS